MQSQSEQFTEPELRTIYSQLLDLKVCREDVKLYEQFVKLYTQSTQRETEIYIKEKANYERAIDLEKQATAQAKDQAKFYKDALDAIKKKPGFGCWIKRIFSAGTLRCAV